MNLDSLKALFSPRRRLQGSSRSSAYTGGILGRQCVLSRGLCRYRIFDDLRVVPAEHRAGALQNKLDGWKPYGEATRHYAGWASGCAHVWAWNGNEVTDDGAPPVPESALQPIGDGVRLVKCIDGFEGQFWSASELKQSQWWPAFPALHAWTGFLRASGQMPSDTVPEAVELTLRDRPWAKSIAGAGNTVVAYERQLVLGGAAVAAVGIAWQLVGLYLDTSVHAEFEGSLTRARQAAEPQLLARERALDDKASAEALQSLFPAFRTLQVMAQTAASLPRDTHLVLWSLQGEELEITLEGQEPDPSVFVRRFQEADAFDEVVAERTRNRDQLSLRMLVSRAPSGTGE